MQSTTPLAIIGAGPAGLSLAYHLGRKGLDYLILEKGNSVASSFRDMYDSIFFGPWMNNVLPGSPKPLLEWLRRTPKKEWLEYLERYTQEHRIKVELDCPVLEVTRSDGQFLLKTPKGDLKALMLVNATGYFGKPWSPNFPGKDTTKIKQMHARDYRNPESIAYRIGSPKGKVLIVGKRVTAGELMVELHNAGYQVELSCKTELKFGSSYLEQAIYGPGVMMVEQLGAWIGVRLDDTNPRMVGGDTKRLVRSGAVPVHPNIAEIGPDTVRFVNGAECKPDIIVYATGYRPVLDHLKGLDLSLNPSTGCPALMNFASVEVPNLYFLGVDNLCSFRSRYLRGIREDALGLARELENRASVTAAFAGASV